MKRKGLQTKKLVILFMVSSLIGTVLSGCGASEDNAAADSAAEESAPDDSYMYDYSDYADYVPEEPATDESFYPAEAEESMDDSGVEYSEGIYDSAYDNTISGESYKEIYENGFRRVADNPLSTFSTDVDTASYSNVRRMIQDGYNLDMIPKNAVRTEELLNYFNYDFDTPSGNIPFAVTTEMGICPWNENNLLLMVGMKTEEIDFSEAPPSNLVFLIDVSGSMYDEDKLPLLQESFAMLADNLNRNDVVSIVTYAGEDRVVLEGTKGSQKEQIVDALNSLSAGGSTNGSAGIITAYELAEEYFIEGGNNRVILATDGDLNVGVTSEDGLERLITEKKESGVFLSVLGFGTGNIRDDNMELLADKGNGNYAYIDSIYESKKVLVDEMGATLVTVAKDVKLQVEFNPAVVDGYRLIGYENRVLADRDFNDDTKDAGEMGAGHTVVALYEINPADEISADTGIKLKYQKNRSVGTKTGGYASDEECCTVSIRYKEPEGSKSSKSEYPVDNDAFRDNNSDDFRFASYVAQFGMVLTDSEYKGDSNLDNVMEGLNNLNSKDEMQEEFYYLVKQLNR